jgi:hypothetical protein
MCTSGPLSWQGGPRGPGSHTEHQINYNRGEKFPKKKPRRLG